MKQKISNKTKIELFKALLKEKKLFRFIEENDLMMDFLTSIWDLDSMPSEDYRFENAYDDIYQHIINNNDWEYRELFVQRLELFRDDVVFIRFLENIVKSQYRESDDEVISFVILINSYLEKEQLWLTVWEYDEFDQPIYSIQNIENNKEHLDVIPNSIPFYVVKSPIDRNYLFSSHPEPNEKPSFVLVHNNTWNDYGFYTIFSLFYYKNNEEKYYIGTTKITDGVSNSTAHILNDTFFTLQDNFCSLGQNFEFYKKLKEVTGKLFESVLLALRDTAFFSSIHDKFEKKNIFIKSLLRDDHAERQLREARHRIYNYDLQRLYEFKYLFKPKYSQEEVEIDFDFNKNSEIPNRIFAIIGENGTGKTQLITQLPLDISKKNMKNFIPRPPLFSKVIAVSYSIFDNFEIPRATSIFNYIYCGLYDISKTEKRDVLTSRQLALRFHKTWKRIQLLDRMEIWKNIILTFIEKDIVDSFIILDEDLNNYTVSVEEFNKAKLKLSSGQSIILYITSEIVSNIRLDSLILFDEPETHLHPNAISQLMNLIYDLVSNFDSYCIVTTHSPLVIQELLSRNVLIMEKCNNLASIRKIGIESFGENLTNLTEEVFGNKNVQKRYKTIINKLVEEPISYDQVVRKLESDNIPLSLNLRMYIKSKLSK
jgi:ABC-type lipoprotein export system ATPase subunit